MTYTVTDLEDLTPGAVFIREDGSKRFVLFVANATLTGKKAERFPIRVVFANSNAEVFDIDVKSFFVKCKFHNVEPELEHRLDSLFVFKTDDNVTLDQAVTSAMQLNEDEENKEILSFDDNESEDVSPVSVTANVGDLTSEQVPVVPNNDFLIPEVTYPISFINTGSLAPKVKAELLQAMLINYQQEPQLSSGYLMHKLTFTVPANITTDAIKSCFDVGSERSDAFYSVFELNTVDFGSDARRVDWSHSIGAYPEYFNGKISLQVVLAEPYKLVSSEPYTIANVTEPVIEEQAIEDAPIIETPVVNEPTITVTDAVLEDTSIDNSEQAELCFMNSQALEIATIEPSVEPTALVESAPTL